LPSNNDPANRPESQPPDLFSSVETRAMLEEFRELVRAGILRVTPENEVLSTQEPASGPGDASQPRTAASREDDVAALDKQLLEWLERRRQQKAEEARRQAAPKSPELAAEALYSNIRQRVIARLAQKILETWDRADQASDVHPSLRDQVVERLAEEILRRWQHKLE
jgi:hypothetical protein